MTGKKNLIMGLWSRMMFDQLEKFIASLRRTTFNGDLCLFVAETTPETIGQLLTHGILVERLDRLSTPQMNDKAGRYFAYLDFLARNSEAYTHVMISDIRDVVFQSDPFANPLPADVVFAQERCLIADSPVNRNWIADTYTPAAADNLRNCMISCSGTTFGTVAGMLSYLVAMTTELASLSGHHMLQARGIDQGVHNYLIRMRPLRYGWLDPTDSLVATMNYMPDAAIQVTPDGVLIDGRMTPVLHQWDRNKITRDYVSGSPRFRLTAERPAPRRALPDTTAFEPRIRKPDRAVVAFYHRARDAEWLAPFLATLRCAGYAGGVHCVGVFDDSELTLLGRFGAVAHETEPTEPALDIENIAHLFISRVLDQLADEAVQPEQALVLDSVRAGFLRDPFQAETIGLSVFQESATPIAESDFNLQRLGFFMAPEGDIVRRPVISSALLRGRLDVLQFFYRKLFAEFVGRAELLRVHKVVQGAINKLCHGDGLSLPVILHPNGGEAYLEIWEEGLPITTVPPIRVSGVVPFAVVNPVRETELMRAVRGSLRL